MICGVNPFFSLTLNKYLKYLHSKNGSVYQVEINLIKDIFVRICWADEYKNIFDEYITIGEPSKRLIVNLTKLMRIRFFSMMHKYKNPGLKEHTIHFYNNFKVTLDKGIFI